MKTFKLILMVLFFGLLANQVTYGQNRLGNTLSLRLPSMIRATTTVLLLTLAELSNWTRETPMLTGSAAAPKMIKVITLAPSRITAIPSRWIPKTSAFTSTGVLPQARKSNYGTAIELSPNFIKPMSGVVPPSRPRGDTDGAAADSQKARELSAK